MENLEVIFPFVLGISFLTFLFVFLVIIRILQYRETVALAEKGLVKPGNNLPDVRSNGYSNTSALRWGIVIASLGLALTLGLWPQGLGSGYLLGIGPWMIVGFIPLFFGLGLILIYVLTRNEKSEPGDTPQTK
jgi:sterol desaturase/sphingolipid hydroxylase (fatty acid hydroxylase superfamily)